MKLSVFMITGFPPPYGGVSVWATELAESLTKKDVKVGCVPLRGIPPESICVYTLPLLFYAMLFELKWIVKKFVDLWYFGLTPSCLRFRFLYVVKALLDCVRIRRALNQETYDIVTGNHAAFDGLTSVLLADLIEAKCVIYEHGAGVLEFPRMFKGAQKITAYCLKNAEAVIVANNFMRKKVIANGAETNKIFIIPPAINVKEYKYVKHKRVDTILFIGSLAKRKDPETLLKAIPSIISRFPQYKFVFVGRGRLHPKLLRESRRMSLTNHVRFATSVSETEKIQLLSRAKVFVLPSVREPFGIVLIEAMASGTPCIASNVGGIPELIDEKVGALVPPKDPKSLASVMINLLSNEEKWRSLSMEARKRAENYDVNDLTEKYIHLFLNLKTRSEMARQQTYSGS